MQTRLVVRYAIYQILRLAGIGLALFWSAGWGDLVALLGCPRCDGRLDGGDGGHYLFLPGIW